MAGKIMHRTLCNHWVLLVKVSKQAYYEPPICSAYRTEKYWA